LAHERFLVARALEPARGCTLHTRAIEEPRGDQGLMEQWDALPIRCERHAFGRGDAQPLQPRSSFVFGHGLKVDLLAISVHDDAQRLGADMHGAAQDHVGERCGRRAIDRHDPVARSDPRPRGG
jgi:hypothetical protein